jgi:hypothetical protein
MLADEVPAFGRKKHEDPNFFAPGIEDCNFQDPSVEVRMSHVKKNY